MSSTWMCRMRNWILTEAAVEYEGVRRMKEIKRWLKQHQAFCTATGIFGLLVSPFLWPVFLAVIFQTMSLVVPVIVIMALWEFFKEEKHEKISERVQKENTEKVPSDESASGEMPKTGETETVRKNRTEAPLPDDEACLAILWYQKEGREYFQRFQTKLERTGKYEFSISNEGICTVRLENRFQRIGILHGYPGRTLILAEKELKKDGFFLKERGQFLWISWKKGGRTYAM